LEKAIRVELFYRLLEFGHLGCHVEGKARVQLGDVLVEVLSVFRRDPVDGQRSPAGPHDAVDRAVTTPAWSNEQVVGRVPKLDGANDASFRYRFTGHIIGRTDFGHGPPLYARITAAILRRMDRTQERPSFRCTQFAAHRTETCARVAPVLPPRGGMSI